MHKIAILDNDLATNRMYEMKLRKHNFTVKSALDGWTGLRLIASFKPDVLIVDFHLPIITGIETIEKLINLPFRQPKIILASNLDHEIVQSKSTHLPIDHYLTKVEHTPAELLHIVRSILPAPS